VAPFVPVLIPARTLANASRLVPQQLVNLLSVRLTRQRAGSAESRARGEFDYNVAARFLWAIHCLQIAAVALGAELIMKAWLPAQAPHITAVLPGMLAEQLLLS